MGQGIWIDSERLGPDDEVREVLKHGTLTVGFIGLAECLKALIGKHHGESEEAQELGLKIVGFIREKADKKAAETKLNFSVIATPPKGFPASSYVSTASVSAPSKVLRIRTTTPIRSTSRSITASAPTTRSSLKRRIMR